MHDTKLTKYLRAGKSLNDADYLPRDRYSIADMIVSIIGAAIIISFGIYAWVR
jgi:hypothetical protein